MSFRLTGIATLLKRHGRNLILRRDADVVYDTNTSETYKTINGWNETTLEFEYSPDVRRLAYVNSLGLRYGEISREPYEGQTLFVSYVIPEGSEFRLVLMISGTTLLNPPLFLNINGERVLLTNHYYSVADEATYILYNFPFPDTTKTIYITFEQPEWQVRGYFYDSKEISILDTQVGEGNRRVALHPMDLTGNPLPLPRIGDTIIGQNDEVSIFRVEPVMSNEKVLSYLCRVKE